MLKLTFSHKDRNPNTQWINEQAFHLSSTGFPFRNVQRSQFAYHCYINLHVCCQTKSNVNTAQRVLIVGLIQCGGGKDLQQQEE